MKNTRIKKHNNIHHKWYMNKMIIDSRPASRVELASAIKQARSNGYQVRNKHWTDGKIGYDITTDGCCFRYICSPTQ